MRKKTMYAYRKIDHILTETRALVALPTRDVARAAIRQAPSGPLTITWHDNRRQGQTAAVAHREPAGYWLVSRSITITPHGCPGVHR